MDEETYLDELDRQFEANIDAITSRVQLLLTTQNSPAALIQFFEWFAKWSRKTINEKGSRGYPDWLDRLTQMSKSIDRRFRAEDPLARAASMISDLINDISYCGTEKHHVDKSLEILRLLEGLSANESQRNTR